MQLKSRKTRASLALAFIAVASALSYKTFATEPEPFVFYSNYLVASDPGFRTEVEAMDYYFAKTRHTAPYNQPCKGYFAQGLGQGLVYKARRVNGVWDFESCAWMDNAVANANWGAGFIAGPLSCSPSSPNTACLALLNVSSAKEAGAPDRPCQVACGNPINPATGNKYQQERDLAVPGSPLLTFSRHYNSAPTAAVGGVMGPKWRHAFEYALEKKADNSIVSVQTTTSFAVPRAIVTLGLL